MVEHLHGYSPVLTPEIRTGVSIIVVVGYPALLGFSEVEIKPPAAKKMISSRVLHL